MAKRMRCKNREELRFWEAVYLAFVENPGAWATGTQPGEFADRAVERRRIREPEPEEVPSKGPFR